MRAVREGAVVKAEREREKGGEFETGTVGDTLED
jgi:hypothetical protein